jgi:transposase-like protein
MMYFVGEIVAAQKEKGRIDLTPVQFKKLYLLRDTIMNEIVKREGHELPPRPLDKRGANGITAALEKERLERQKIGAQYVVNAAMISMLEERNKSLFKSTDLAKDIKEGMKMVSNGDVMKRIYSHYSSSMRQHSPTYPQLCNLIQNLHTVAGQKRLLQLIKQRLADMPDILKNTTTTVDANGGEQTKEKKGRKRPMQKEPSGMGRYMIIMLNRDNNTQSILFFFTAIAIKASKITVTPPESQDINNNNNNNNNNDEDDDDLDANEVSDLSDESDDGDDEEQAPSTSTAVKSNKRIKPGTQVTPVTMINMEAESDEDDELNLVDDYDEVDSVKSVNAKTTRSKAVAAAGK